MSILVQNIHTCLHIDVDIVRIIEYTRKKPVLNHSVLAFLLAQYVPHFKPGKELRERVDKGT